MPQPLSVRTSVPDAIVIVANVCLRKSERSDFLRHAFSVATILRWHAEGEDVNSMMPYLSAYLGHRKLSNTYWYLTGVPELMAVAADSFRAMGLGGGGL